MQKVQKYRFVITYIIAILLFILGLIAGRYTELLWQKMYLNYIIPCSVSANTLIPTSDLSTLNVADTYGRNDISYFNAELTTAAESVTEKQPRYILTDEEKRMICFVADCEDNSSIKSRQAIMQVIMNRVESDKFPDTVKDVLYQKKQFVTIKQYKNDYIPSNEALEALNRILYGNNIFNGECALFFAAKYVNPARIAKSLYLIAEIGETKFWGQS